jgi:glycosyltransferase involved in cell wall biosynthesis
MNRSLVTFALFSYNHERFIREAVRGALTQTYSPLQIVISDDCSQDRTFEIIQEEVASYEGPHRVLLNRNERNLGVAGHHNRMMELAEGRLIVAAAGDDVSLPTRTEEFARAWSEGGVFSVYSNYFIVDEDGTERGVEEGIASEWKKSWQDRIRSTVVRGLGCADAWDRAVFDTFGPLPDEVVREDVAIPFRAALLGKIVYVDKCLVKYRRHGANLWKRHDDLLMMDLSQFKRRQVAVAQVLRTDWECRLRDIQLFSSIHPEMEAELLWAMEVTAARTEFYRFKEFALSSKGIDRMRECLQAIKRVRSLGIGPMVKVGLLSASPRIYCKIYQWRYQRKRLESMQ